MGRRALFEKYISGLRTKKEERAMVSKKVRWITLSGDREEFNENALMSVLGVFGLDVYLVCKTINEQALVYNPDQKIYVKCELLEDKTFRVFLSPVDGGFESVERDVVCQRAVAFNRVEVKSLHPFISSLKDMINRA